MTLNDLLLTRYKRFARGPEEYDCWGLARAAWHGIFGKGQLPDLSDVCPTDKRRLTLCAKEVVSCEGLGAVRLRSGALATAWRGKICVHIGIVIETTDGRTWILETDEGVGPSLTDPNSFASRYEKVIFYDRD